MLDEVFNIEYQKLSKHFNTTHILSIESIFNLLNCENYVNCELLLLTTRKKPKSNNDVIPTLSIIKKRNDEPKVLSNLMYLSTYLNELSSTSSSKKEMSFEEIEQKLSLKGFICFSYTKYDCYIFIQNFNELKSSITIDKIAKSLFFIKKQSLNLLNDSFKKRDKILNDAKELCTPKVKTFLERLIKYFNNLYPYINFHTLEYIEKDNKWVCFNNCPLYISDICTEVTDRLKNELIPLNKYIDNKQHIIFPFVSHLDYTYVQYAIVLYTEDYIDTHIIDNFKYITNYYYAVYLKQEKYNILNELNTRTLNLPNEILSQIQNEKKFDIKRLLNHALSDLFCRIIEVSNIHSISLRIINNQNDTLEQVVVAHDENSVNHNKTKNNELMTILPISIHSLDSQVSLTFREKRKVYSPNVKSSYKFPKAYQNNRLNSRSELSYPICYKNIIIGVINFESPLSNGLKEYSSEEAPKLFDKLKQRIENYIKVAYDSNDMHWVARRSQMYQNNHEIRRVIEEENIPLDIKDKLNYYINFIPIQQVKSQDKLGSLIQYRQQLVNSYFENEANAQVSKSLKSMYEFGIKIRIIDSNKKISLYKIDMIKIIYKNLVDNFHFHSNKKKDTVWIFQKKNKRETIEILFIKAKMYNIDTFYNKDLKSLLLTPYNEEYLNQKDEIVKKTHYGLFMVGMLTRYLDGFASLSIKNNNEFAELNIEIPLKENK